MVAAVIIATSSLEFLFYVSIVSAATASYECPYQTPVPLLLRMLVYCDIRRDRWYRRRAHIFKSFRSRVWDWFPGSKRGPAGPTMRPDPRRLGGVSSMKTWSVSERKKPTDPEASTAAAPTNDINELVRKTPWFRRFTRLSRNWAWDRDHRRQQKTSPRTNSTKVPLRSPCRRFRPHQRAPFRVGQSFRPFSQTR